MSEQQPSEEEIRARLEEELRKISVRDVLLQTAVTLINLGGQRLGLGQSSEGRDLEQTRTAIEAVRALLPQLEQEAPQEMAPLRDALAQLQMVYAREAGGASADEPGAGGAGGTGSGAPPGDRPAGGEAGAGPAPGGPQRPGSSGRLWVPPGSR